MKTVRRGSVAGILAVSAIALAGCGGSAGSGQAQSAENADAFSEYRSLTGQEREDALYEDAQDEGELSIYTSWKYMDTLLDGFVEKYPGIRVEPYVGGSEDVLQKTMQEVKSNQQTVDVIETNQMEMTAMTTQGLFEPYASEYREGIREEARQSDWTAIRYNAFVVEWNTDMVPAGSEPRSLEELTDAKWAGHLSMEVGDASWLQGLYAYFSEEGMSDEEFQELFEGLAANSESVSGHTAWGDLLAAGKYQAALSQYLQVVDESEQKGAPVAYRTEDGTMPEPVLLQANGMGIMKHAPHPAAATLFMDYALSDEGQQLIEDEQIIGARVPADDPLEGVATAYLDSEDLVENNALWIERYDKLLRGDSRWWG